MSDDDDAIFIDVVPRVDEAAADQAEEKLRDKFKDVAKDIGGDFLDALGDSGLADELGTKLGSALSDPLKGLGEKLGLDLQSPLEKLINHDLSGALDDVAGDLGTKLGDALKGPLNELNHLADNIGVNMGDVLKKVATHDMSGALDTVMDQLGTKFGSVLGNGLKDLTGIDLGGVADKLRPIADVIQSARGHDLAGALQGVNSLTGGGLQPLMNMHDTVHQTVSDTHDIMEELFGAGYAGEKMPIAATEALAPALAGMALVAPTDSLLKDLPGGAGTYMQEHLPDDDDWNWFKAPFRHMAGSFMHPSRMFGDHHGQRYYDKNGNYIGPGSAAAAPPPEPDHVDTLYQGVFGQPYSGGGKTTANEVEVQSSVATVSAGSVTLGGSINLPAGLVPGAGQGGSPTALGKGSGGGASAAMFGGGRGATLGHGAGGGGSASLFGGGGGGTTLGGYAQGGMLPGDSPGHDNILGSLGGKPIGLEGGEFIVNPSAARANFDLLKAINSGSGMAHFDGGGPLDPQNPSLFMPPTQGNQPSGGQGGGPIQQTPIGTGKGAGISGGGLIGAAEQAGVAAAGVAGFGAGGVAAQMAEQEINLAVQKGSQAAWAAASAPLETLWLGGGEMGAPKLQSPLFGWPGKLLGGLIGSQTNLPNMAHAVQPPKQPDQKGQHEGQDPAGQPKGGAGPKGSRDDPMHVNVTNQPQQPMGATTDAAKITSAMALGTA